MEHHIPSHEHYEHHEHHEHHDRVRSSFVLRIPKPNWQVSALLIIAVIAALQTVQLVRLKQAVAQKPAAVTSSSASSGTTSSGSASGLESQVGGC